MSNLPVPVTTERNEAGALTRLAFGELARAAGSLQMMEQGIADRVFWALGPLGKPARWAHDGITNGVYSGLTASMRAAGRPLEMALDAAGAGERVLSATPGGATLIGAINGLIGDSLEEEGNDLHEPMSIRVAGERVALERAELAEAFPQAAPRIVVFVHGLMGTEFTWWLGARKTGATYGSRLAEDLGCTPVYVRFNTGRHISENGRSLADSMEALVAEWPVEVDEVALVGHSMGGLVSRSACFQAAEDGAEWTKRVRHVVSLGTPHMGAPMAQAAHYAAAAFNKLPETRMMGAFLGRRSAGIRDLRHGSLVDEDWRDRDPDALRTAACKEVPLLDGATHCFVSAALTRSHNHPIARVVGDTLVLVPSASGRSRTRRIPFREEDGAYIGGANHLALLNHPAVYDKLRYWLSTPPSQLSTSPALASGGNTG
jgi:pimeloyl-ACP methyl ester carboxylesterase